MRDTPIHLVAGPLGVGKSTAILDFLARREAGERIAVLVNDCGYSGLDGQRMEQLRGSADLEKELEIIPVSGGCVCCSNNYNFTAGLRQLSERPDIDRILVEPSGIVFLDVIKTTIQDFSKRQHGDGRNGLVLQSVILLLNPARTPSPNGMTPPFYVHLATESDILVANWCDQATHEQIDAFHHWAATLPAPTRRVLQTSHGVLPIEVFSPSVASNRSPADADTVQTPAPHPPTDSHSWPSACIFDLPKLSALLTDLSKNQILERFKGFMHTGDGWRDVHLAQGQVQSRPIAASTLSQADWIGIDAQTDIHILEKLNQTQHPR